MPRQKKIYYEITINVCSFCGLEEEFFRKEQSQYRWDNKTYQQQDVNSCKRCVECMPSPCHRAWIEGVISIATGGLRDQVDRLESRLDRLSDI